MAEEKNRLPLTVEGIEAALQLARSPESRQLYIDRLRERVRQFEQRNRMRTKDLVQALEAGEATETHEVIKWLLAAEALSQAEKRETGQHE